MAIDIWILVGSIAGVAVMGFASWHAKKHNERFRAACWAAISLSVLCFSLWAFLHANGAVSSSPDRGAFFARS
jgi:hypothetical protein